MLLPHDSSMEDLKCGYEGCQYSCKYRQQLKRHKTKANHNGPSVRSVIASGGAFYCGKCNKKFSYNSNAYRHTKNCKGIPASNVKEESKGETKEKQFHSKQRVIRGDGGFFCSICNKRYNWNSNAYRHVKQCEAKVVVNEVHKLYKCHVCKKEFRDDSRLKKHLLLHDSSKKSESISVRDKNSKKSESTSIRDKNSKKAESTSKKSETAESSRNKKTRLGNSKLLEQYMNGEVSEKELEDFPPVFVLTGAGSSGGCGMFEIDNYSEEEERKLLEYISDAEKQSNANDPDHVINIVEEQNSNDHNTGSKVNELDNIEKRRSSFEYLYGIEDHINKGGLLNSSVPNKSLEFHHKQKKVHSSIDRIYSTLSTQKPSLATLIGKNILDYLRKSKKKFVQLPPDAYHIISKCLGDDDRINDEILTQFSHLLSLDKQILVQYLNQGFGNLSENRI